MTAGYVAIADAADVPVGACKAISADGVRIVLAHLKDGFRALENRCSHANSPLLTDKIYRGDQIACPIHGARFELKTGRAMSPPAFTSLKTYPVRVSDGRVEVAIEA
jgi:nitrite reductase/ring-hydroxylating ferredoxin subunit